MILQTNEGKVFVVFWITFLHQIIPKVLFFHLKDFTRIVRSMLLTAVYALMGKGM